MRTDGDRASNERSTDEPKLVWPISVADHGDYTTIGLPDRLSDGRPFTEETYHQFPTLEELGIEDWSSDVLNAVIPDDRAVAVCSSSSAWKPSKWRRADRELWSWGVRWRYFSLGGWLSIYLPPETPKRQQFLSKSLGFEDEWNPQMMLVYSANSCGEWEPREIYDWCRNEDLWWNPSRLLGLNADWLLVIHDGSVYLAAGRKSLRPLLAQLEELAGRWSLSIRAGRTESVWFLPSRRESAHRDSSKELLGVQDSS